MSEVKEQPNWLDLAQQEIPFYMECLQAYNTSLSGTEDSQAKARELIRVSDHIVTKLKEHFSLSQPQSAVELSEAESTYIADKRSQWSELSPSERTLIFMIDRLVAK